MSRTYHRSPYESQFEFEPEDDELTPEETKGGKPSKGTPKDGRLKENQPGQQGQQGGGKGGKTPGK